MTGMAKTQFWHLSSPVSTGKLADSEREPEYEQITCSLDPEHRRAGRRLDNPPLVLPGRTVDDFVWTWLSECLIQNHVLRLFREYHLTGFDVKPVETRFKKASAEEPPKLWELVVTGWAGIAEPESVRD